VPHGCRPDSTFDSKSGESRALSGAPNRLDRPCLVANRDRCGQRGKHPERQRTGALRPFAHAVVILDPQSREIIDRSVNAPSRRVVRQIPEAAVRRLKAYTRPGKQQASPQDQHADIEV
jgi:hypothetical protein